LYDSDGDQLKKADIELDLSAAQEAARDGGIKWVKCVKA